MTHPEPQPDTGPRFPEVFVQLTGQDGNGFGIAARVRKALETAGHRDEARECFDEMLSGDYDHLLATAMRWVAVG